jgi:two-component system, OmpR family, phosphate regulon sensor histidine kinase PhoR
VTDRRAGPVTAGPRGRDVADRLGAGLVHFTASLTIDEANRPAHELLATAPGRLIGRGPLEAFLDRGAEELVDAAQRTGSASAELTIRDGGTRTIVVQAWDDGEGGVWLLIDDVSELRRLQRIRTEFIDNLSHELRTPLSSISLLAETLAGQARAAGDALPARMRDRIDKIEVETGHLVQMVDEMLDLGRIESGEPMRMDDLVDIGTLASDAARRLAPFAERQGVTFALDVAEDLPMLHGNEQRLGQVLLNLVHNAVKFSPDGGEVAIRVTRSGSGVVVDVEDHGAGIARGDLPRIFERFYKADRARVRGGGTGLGLSIARHIVEAHGGSIIATSDIGLGSTFTVRIPLEAAPGPDDDPR